MAGNFPDVPDHRMPYDRDGSILFSHTFGSAVIIQHPNDTSVTGSKTLNNESDSIWSLGGGGNWFANDMIGVMFPELRTVTGFFICRQSGIADTLQWSPNTTSGADGTWNTAAATFTHKDGLIGTSYRDLIQPLSLTGVRAIKFRQHGGESGFASFLRVFHLYGNIESGQNPDRLRFWHPTLDQEVGGAYFDWGNSPRNTVQTRTFRIKNNSATFTANGIVVGREALTDTTPSVVGQHELSVSGTYAASQNIGNLAPGAISSVITVRRTTPSNAALSLWTLRLTAEATSWS